MKPFITRDEDYQYWVISYKDRQETLTFHYVEDMSELWKCPEEKFLRYIANYFMLVVDEGRKPWWRGK